MMCKHLVAVQWLLLTCLITLCAGQALAHEFWLQPAKYETLAAEPVAVSIRNGENFQGDSLPYLPPAFVKFSLSGAQETFNIEGQIGDMQPLVPLPQSTGLKILSYESVSQRLEYSTYAKFKQFTQEEGVSRVLQDHQAESAQSGPVREIFRRFAKSLISAGAVAGSDRSTGLELELIALDNPYQNSQNGTLQMQLLYQGQPLVGAQVTIYSRLGNLTAERDVEITDSQGIVAIPRMANREYLVNAVHIRSPGVLEKFIHGTDWETLWASLTFRVPDDSVQILVTGKRAGRP